MQAEYISHMGSDLTVVNAARVSFDKQSDWEGDPMGGVVVLSERDERLINYLARHAHWTPFAHPQITMRETVPIFVARQRFKHQIGFVYNEVSRRYVDDIPEFFTPSCWRSKPEENKKQGSGPALSCDLQQTLKRDILQYHQMCMTKYFEYLDKGVCAEQARMVLPQSMYTSYYVTGSLAAWARAYNQRIDRSHAQGEIADLAVDWGKILQPLFPVSWKALISR